MLNLKRSAQDPILPVRASKHRKTSALYGDSPTASQGEGLLSHWISSFVNLTKAASGIVMDALKEPQPQRFSSSSLRRPDAAEQQRPPSARPSSLPSRQQRRSRSPKTRTGRTSPHSRHASDHDSTALRSNVLPSGQPEVASSSEPSQSVPGLHRDASDHASSASAANGGSPPLKQRLLPETIGPSGEPLRPQSQVHLSRLILRHPPIGDCHSAPLFQGPT
ncbi:hypothetical protein BC834DRAFT_449204 [Gloeopeniophorella convolvens]|nr:hypothetical protein BC834DRAFT_449204 [Gloeopeniophorella convolvens]